MNGINWMIAKATVTSYIASEDGESFLVTEGYFSGKLPARLTSTINGIVKTLAHRQHNGVSNWKAGNTSYAFKTGMKMSTKDSVDFTWQTIEPLDTELWASGD